MFLVMISLRTGVTRFMTTQIQLLTPTNKMHPISLPYSISTVWKCVIRLLQIQAVPSMDWPSMKLQTGGSHLRSGIHLG